MSEAAVEAQAVRVISFGCRLNTYESEVMRKAAATASCGPTVIINTCAVTAEAERQARQAIRRARRDHPDATVIVTGCAAQIDPARYAAMPEVDRVLGNREKLDPASYGTQQPLLVSDIMAVRETAQHLIDGFEGRARAFVEIQQGCDHRCTFCIIPFGRGNSRSVPAGPIIDQIRVLVAGGYREIVLTGVDITSYGGDLPGRPTLGELCARILRYVPELPRLRLSSLDPVEIDEALWRLIAVEPRLMPHLHLSVQHGADIILKRMKRRHLAQDVVTVCARARRLRPDIAFGADIIAGFPTETEADAAASARLVDEAGLAFLHVFPYSPRPGTPAARMPQLPRAVVKERAEALRRLGQVRRDAHLDAQIGRPITVLMETETQGRAEDFSLAEADRAPVGAIIRARVVAAADGVLRTAAP